MYKLKKYWQSIRFSLGFAFTYTPKQTFLLSLIVIARSIFPFATGYYLGKLIDVIITGVRDQTGLSNIWYFLILYALVTSLPSMLGNIQIFVRRIASSILTVEVELYIMRKREALDIATYEDAKFQDLNQRSFRNGLGPIYNTISGQYETLYSVAGLIVGTFIAVHFDPLIYLIIILTAVPSFLVDMKFAARGWGIWAKDSMEQRRYADLRGYIVSKNSLIETKLLQSGKKLLDWMRDILWKFNQKQMEKEKDKLFQTTITDIISALGLFLGLFLLVREVMNGELPVGSLVFMMSTLLSVRSSISGFLVNLSNQYEDSLIVNDIREIVNMAPVIIEPSEPVKLDLTSAPEIIFENVSFKYPHSKNYSLRKINLTMKPGSKIGLVGNNGAGKTTFVKLLCRIYDPTEGRILINGIDLKNISISEWWSNLGVMFQDYPTYDFLVKESIAIGKPDQEINFVKVREAAEISQASGFIESWKNKYDQQIGVVFSGVEPSKGQRQKLSIAKIIYRNARLMILDEPTASVDAESEAKIFSSLENLSKDTSALLISHDFSTISQCDVIFVLENGELIESGNHKELMNLGGKYAELYHLQAKRFKK